MKKQTINIRLYEDFEGVKGALKPVLAVEWPNLYGARIFVDKRLKDKKWYSTEYASGLCLTSAKTRKEMLLKITSVLDQSDKLVEFHTQIEANVKKWGYANV
jgi:hypothetical protein